MEGEGAEEEMTGGQNDQGTSLQNGGEEEAEGSGRTTPTAPPGEGRNQLDGIIPESHPDVRFAGGSYRAETASDMEDLEPLPEEETKDLMVLPADHPHARKRRVDMTNVLRKQWENFDLALNNELKDEKQILEEKEELLCGLFEKQQLLSRVDKKLTDDNEANAEAQAKQKQAEDQLEPIRDQYAHLNKQHKDAKANASQSQACLDNQTQEQLAVQEASEELHKKFKTMQNVRHRDGTEKSQAEELNLKMDLYVDRLTKDLYSRTQKKAMFEAQFKAQAEEVRTVKEALSELGVNMEEMLMARRHLVGKWNDSLLVMRAQDEACSAKLEALREVEHQVILLDQENKGNQKAIAAEEELNETLTMKLELLKVDAASSKKLLSQKKAQLGALQAQYTISHSAVLQTEKNLASLTKEANMIQATVNDRSAQIDKIHAKCLELENKIMSHMQQQLSHNNQARFSERLALKTANIKNEMMCELQQLENEASAALLENQRVDRNVDCLAVAQESLDEEMAELDKLLTAHQTEISSMDALIEQNLININTCDSQLHQFMASTGQQDLSVLQLTIEAIIDEMEEVAANMKRNKELEMKQCQINVGMMQEIEANRTEMLQLQMMCTELQRQEIQYDSQIESERQEEREMEAVFKVLLGEQAVLSSYLDENELLDQALDEENEVMGKGSLRALKEVEMECIEMLMEIEGMQEENDQNLEALIEADQQMSLWMRKTVLVEEICESADSEAGEEENKTLKDEVQQMEVLLSRLKKEQDQLLSESEDMVQRLGDILDHRFVALHSPHKQTETKADLNLVIQGLTRKINETEEHVAECVDVIEELHRCQVNMDLMLMQQMQSGTDVHNTTSKLSSLLDDLQDSVDKGRAEQAFVQEQVKLLQALSRGGYRASTSRAAVGAALQEETENIHAVFTIIHRVCEEFPQHQETLRRVWLTLASHTQ